MIIRDVLAGSGQFSANFNFRWIELEEPSKGIVKSFTAGSDFGRRAKLSVVDYDKRKTFEVVVNIGKRSIASLKDLGGLQPGIDDHDIAIARSIIDSDVEIKQALIRRGLEIPGKLSDAVPVLYYSIGHDNAFDDNRHRLMRVVFASDQNALNTGSPFLDGVMIIVDLYTKKVIRLVDRSGLINTKVPHDIFRLGYSAILDQTDHKAGKPQARDIHIEDNLVSWRNWKFRYSFNLREGLVLYQIAVDDDGRWRSVVYRASVSETVTSYLDPSELWSWLDVMDEGGGGLGSDSVAVQPGREVPDTAVALDVLLPDPAQATFSRVFDKRIYVYERDGGNLIYYRQGEHTAHASSTELVIGFFASLGNYDYGFNWIFKQDGSFAFEVELAGEVLTKFVNEKRCQTCTSMVNGSVRNTSTFESRGDDRFGTLVYPHVLAVNHQHWFNLRLDFDVDGTDNAVMENNLSRVGANSRHGAVDDNPTFTATHTVFARARDAKRDANHESARSWTIYNPTAVDQIGRPAGYMIMPREVTTTKYSKSREPSTVGFTFHHVWVTPLRDGEFYAAGRYPDQAKMKYRDSLYYYANDDPIYNKDIVIWYSLGDIHMPRVEDYPLMPNVKLGVNFIPDGFFSRNPALGTARGQ